MTKWNALALGLAATVIFSGGETQAQFGPFGMTPAEVWVTRAGDSFIFSSNHLQDPTDVCEFEFPIRLLDAEAGVFPTLGDFGTTNPDGSLTADRDELLAALGLRAAKFSMFCTSCGSNSGGFGARPATR